MLERIFGPPRPGSLLKIPSRHPIQMWLMASFVLGGLFQLFFGPEGGTLNATMPHGLFNTSALMMLTGGLLALVSAAVVRRKPWDAIGYSLCSMIMLSAVMSFYLYMYVEAIPHWWTVFGFWFVFALCGGFVHRGVELAAEALRIWRHR